MDQVFFLFLYKMKVYSKELEKTSTKFSAKYRILTINMIYFSEDFISLRMGKEIEKEEDYKYTY